MTQTNTQEVALFTPAEPVELAVIEGGVASDETGIWHGPIIVRKIWHGPVPLDPHHLALDRSIT